jgi:hypothetical protein
MRQEAETDHVFLDRSGRRRRLLKIVGAGVATSLVTVLLLLVAALSGVSPVDLPGLPHAAGKDAARPTVRPSTTLVRPVDTRAGVVPTPTTSPTGTPTPSTSRRHGQSTKSPHPTKSK